MIGIVRQGHPFYACGETAERFLLAQGMQRPDRVPNLAGVLGLPGKPGSKSLAKRLHTKLLIEKIGIVIGHGPGDTRVRVGCLS